MSTAKAPAAPSDRICEKDFVKLLVNFICSVVPPSYGCMSGNKL